MTKEALTLALEAMRGLYGGWRCESAIKACEKALAQPDDTAKLYEELRSIIDGGSESFTHEDAVQYLKDKLAQPEQEPVAWGIIASNTGRICQVELDADEVEGHNPKHIVPLYTTPPQRKPLTDGQINVIWDSLIASPDYSREMIVRAIEAAHGIKE